MRITKKKKKEADSSNEFEILPKPQSIRKTPLSITKKIVVEALPGPEPLKEQQHEDLKVDLQEPKDSPLVTTPKLQLTAQSPPHTNNIYLFDDICSHPPHRLILPPIESRWKKAQLLHQPSLDLEGGTGSPLSSPRKFTHVVSDRHGKYRPNIHNNPAAESVDDLLRLQADLEEIISIK